MALVRLSDSNRNSLFPSLIDRFFEGDLLSPIDIMGNTWNFSGTNTTLPAVNIKENDNEYEIEVAAPGMRKEDFKVNYDNGRLTISSERKEEKKESNGEKVARREFSYQSFQRSFTVTEDTVNTDRIGAKYADGILYVTLPKSEQAKPRPVKQIAIK